jgi:hypothetical protein
VVYQNARNKIAFLIATQIAIETNFPTGIPTEGVMATYEYGAENPTLPDW